MIEDRRHAPPRLRALEMIEERALAGKLAGTLYVTGAITAATILLIPGVERTHWRLMLCLSAIGFAWAACCFFLIPWERAHPLVSHFSCSLGFPITAVAVAATGGGGAQGAFFLPFIVRHWAGLLPRPAGGSYPFSWLPSASPPPLFYPAAPAPGL